ncbi:dihydroorotase [Candidatus Obscuribacterales bacterium]|nr:dihydroorotase [Candidatus Obscuribacterales bacterium]
MTTGKILLRRGLIVPPHQPGKGTKKEFHRADVRIADGVIKEISEELAEASDETVIEANDLWITPGLIDIHTHLRDLNQAGKETIESGTRAAAAGGFTTVVSMANTDPPTDTPRIFSIIKDKIEETACIRVLPLAAVTLGLKGEQLTEMAQLAELGAIAFSDDGMPLHNLAVMARGLQFAKLLNKTIISHPEDHALSKKGCMHDSQYATKLGLEGIPSVSESACVAREIEVVRAVGGRLHFAHVSTCEAIQLIKRAKEDGLSVTAEVSPHHITLADEDIRDFDTRFKMNPPLRSKRDQNQLVEALKEGIFDAIATDHAPHTKQEKAQAFASAPFGIIGLETAFSVVYQRLVKEEHLTINELIYLLTSGPASVIGLPDPALVAGSRADIAVIDPKRDWTYQTTKGFSKSSNSPYDGVMLSAKVVATIANGKIVYQDRL